MKYLGAWLDSELSLKTHVKKNVQGYVKFTEDKEHPDIPN